MVDEVVWNTSRDDLVCTICGELDGTHIGIGDLDAYPPNGSHPGCRCWVQPVLSEKRFEEALDEVFS